MNKNKQKIELTKEQFKTLLKTVYLGNWLANASRTGAYKDPHIEEYKNMENYMFSFAEQFGLEEWVDDEEASEGIFFPTCVFEEGTDVGDLINDYNEANFWDELIDRLGERDFRKNYSEEEIRKMTREERFGKLYELTSDWRIETSEYGVERLKIAVGEK